MKKLTAPDVFRARLCKLANVSFVLLSILLASSAASAVETELLNPTAPTRLPARIDARPITPDFGCFWSFDLETDNYKTLIDALGPVNAFDVLSITLRNLSSFYGNDKAIETTKKAAEYAKSQYGVDTIIDLDLRVARYDFEKKHPDLAQERLMFANVDIPAVPKTLSLSFNAPTLTDHYTGNYPYFVRGGRVVRAWAYRRDENGMIIPDSVINVTDLAAADAEQYFVEDKPGYDVDQTVKNSLEVSFKSDALPQSADGVTVAVAFRYSYPDVFADETLELERRLYESYRDVPTLGGYKDEWGFPPCFDREDKLNDYWYSERMASAYANRFNGENLVDDLFLACQPQKDRERERIKVLDQFHKLCSDRVLDYENQNYRLNKELWGRDAFVGVHCTWYPWPNMLEMRKNGLMWWKAPRDVAQTDEYVPFSARNSMAKGCGSLWINMFYAKQTSPYITEYWTAAAAGGRVHVHNIYPRDDNSPKNEKDSRLLPIVGDAGGSRVREKIRMLNIVTNSQIDSPVAVVFSRFGAANPLRQEYQAVGTDICDRFSSRGFPCDLLPVDEIFSSRPDGTLKWSVQDGRLAYGDQKYEALIFFGENDAEEDAWNALRNLADDNPEIKTRFVSIPAGASSEEKEQKVAETIVFLERGGVLKQTPWVGDPNRFGTTDAETSLRPPRTAFSRFIDGTLLWIAATASDFGDPIVLQNERIKLKDGGLSPNISARANGVFSVRFDKQGALDAVVIDDAKSLEIGDFSFELSDEEIGDDPVDVAVWRDAQGNWRGVFQRKKNDLPEALRKLVPTWNYLQKI